jgi:cyclic pyranopterin phosphate synthase
MPLENYRFMPHSKLMSADEVYNMAKIFCHLGVNKIRLTGGEPLVRKDFGEIIEKLAQLPAQILLTTNGILIDEYLPILIKHQVSNINLSLDTLNAEKFKLITKRNQFDRVWSNMQLLLEKGFKLKINVVAMKGLVEDELLNFVELTRNWPIHLRFIEFMPFTDNGWDKSKVISAEAMLAIIGSRYDVIKLKDEPHATAKKYMAIGHQGTLAFITTMSQQFCGECNRLRLTAEGKIKNCLFGKEEIDLLSSYRSGADIEALIKQSVQRKHFSMGGQFIEGSMDTNPQTIENRSMISIGG